MSIVSPIVTISLHRLQLLAVKMEWRQTKQPAGSSYGLGRLQDLRRVVFACLLAAPLQSCEVS
jgi:hypothetical protein